MTWHNLAIRIMITFMTIKNKKMYILILNITNTNLKVYHLGHIKYDYIIQHIEGSSKQWIM